MWSTAYRSGDHAHESDGASAVDELDVPPGHLLTQRHGGLCVHWTAAVAGAAEYSDPAGPCYREPHACGLVPHKPGLRMHCVLPTASHVELSPAGTCETDCDCSLAS